MATERVIYTTIGQRVRELREGLQMTQDELAALVGLTRTSITNIEKGIQKLGIDTLYDLAAVFGMDARDLLPEVHPDPVVAEAYRKVAELKHQQVEAQRELRRVLNGDKNGNSE
jgi:transcriptional regulator with XRE-family HTH domain